MSRYIFDIETNGLLPDLTTIHCIVLKDIDTGETHSHDPDNLDQALALLAGADEIIGHNIIKFDIPAIRKVYPDFKPRGKVIDTLTIARLIWPTEDLRDRDFKARNRPNNPIALPGYLFGSFGLEAWGWRLNLHKGDYAKEMKARGLDPWENWTPEMQSYCEQDVKVTDRLYEMIRKKNWSQDAIDLELEVQTILWRQEQYGFCFDEQQASNLYTKLVKRKLELEEALQSAFPPWFRRKKEFTPARNNKTLGYVEGCAMTKVEVRPFNPGSRHDIANRLEELRGWKPSQFTPEGQPKLDETILLGLPYPEARLLAEYFLVKKRLGMLAEGKQAWLKVVKENGRIHGGVITNGAVTGRMTHKSPNLAQVPANDSPYGKECRALFVVPEDKSLVGCDADALELRCLAGYMAKYDGGKYIKIVLEGKKEDGTDIHSENARALGLDPKKKYPVKGKKITGRDIAKTWFYAYIYGAGNVKLGEILGRVGRSKAAYTGKKSRKRFEENLPALGQLSNAIAKKIEIRTVKHPRTENVISLGYLTGLDGRHLKIRSEHSTLNTLLQSAGAILMKKALVIFDQDLQAQGYKPGIDYEFVANVHDEWQIETDKEIAENVGQMARKAIRKAGDAFRFRCPLDGNYAIGRNWAATH